jgi:hypothetical protein
VAAFCYDVQRQRMSRISKLLFALAALAGIAAALPPAARAQSCSVDFTARITPAAGLAEPVRGFPFYLLHKSYTAILAEADAAEPKPDLDAFVDKLKVSPELKAWMKKHHTVSLSGEEFVRGLTVDEILHVPEFFSAYVERNAGDKSVNFPKPKYKERDQQKDPGRYEKEHQEYLEAIRKFMAVNQESTAGLDLVLDPINPGPQWESLAAKRGPDIHRRALELAQTHYLVAKAESDLDGHGRMSNIPPGNYWLGTLDIFASVGDAYVRWDVPVSVDSGLTTRVELSNSNGISPQKPAP